MVDELAAAGTESQLRALIARLDRRRIEPTVCLLRGESPTSRALEPKDCVVHRLDIRSFKHPSSLAKAWRFFRLLRRERFDILQVYFPESTYLGVLMGRLAGVSRIVRTRNNLGYWMRPIDRWLGRLCNRFTHALVANCVACREAFERDEGFLPARSVVLENGVDLERFPERASGSMREPVGVVANLPGEEPERSRAARVAADFPHATFTSLAKASFGLLVTSSRSSASVIASFCPARFACPGVPGDPRCRRALLAFRGCERAAGVHAAGRSRRRVGGNCSSWPTGACGPAGAAGR